MKAIKILLAISLLVAVAACKKSDNTSHSTVNVRMTDAPGNFTAVNIDLQTVAVTGSGGAEVFLNTNAGVYNLLNFSNGVDTLIATGGIDGGSIEQVRLVLGSNNSVVVNGVTYPLSTPSAQQSGLKLNVHQDMQAGVAYNLVLDFDANQSIVQQGNGDYQLKPVIRATEVGISGSIKGSVFPITALANVTATANGNSYSTVTNASGQFVVSALPAGTYTLEITPIGLTTVTLHNITVNTGITSDVGVVNL